MTNIQNRILQKLGGWSDNWTLYYKPQLVFAPNRKIILTVVPDGTLYKVSHLYIEISIKEAKCLIKQEEKLFNFK